MDLSKEESCPLEFFQSSGCAFITPELKLGGRAPSAHSQAGASACLVPEAWRGPHARPHRQEFSRIMSCY